MQINIIILLCPIQLVLKASKQDVLNKKDDIQHVINIEHEEAEGEENRRLKTACESGGKWRSIDVTQGKLPDLTLIFIQRGEA